MKASRPHTWQFSVFQQLALGKKSYTETFGQDLYKVKPVKYFHPVFIYSWENENGVELEGGFYEAEITRVHPPED